MKTILKEAIAQEQLLQALITRIRQEVFNAMQVEPMDGVSPVQNTSIRAATVSFSTISSNNFNLSPEYYIPESQAGIVERRLRHLTSAAAVKAALQEMADTGAAKYSGERHELNPKSISAIKNYLKNCEEE